MMIRPVRCLPAAALARPFSAEVSSAVIASFQRSVHGRISAQQQQQHKHSLRATFIQSQQQHQRRTTSSNNNSTKPSSAASSSSSSVESSSATRTTTTTTTTSYVDSQPLWKVASQSVLIGSVAGALGSLAGMGGGFVMIPMMTAQSLGFLRLTQHQAHGTSLFAVMATGMAGAISYGHSVVQIPEAMAVAISAMITARWGAQTTLALGERSLRKALGIFMLLMAPLVPAKAYYYQHVYTEEKKEEEAPELSTESIPSQHEPSQWSFPKLIAPSMIGLGSGFLAGLFGVGGGTIVVPALTIFTDCTHHQALATSLAAMIPPAMTGTYSHYVAGNCSMRVAPFLATGALLGAYIGAQQSLQTNENTLRWGFSGLLAFLGLRTILKA